MHKEILAAVKPVSTEKAIKKEKQEVEIAAQKSAVKKAIKEVKKEADKDSKKAIKEDKQRRTVLQQLLEDKILQVNGADYFLYGYPSVKMPDLLVDRFVDYVILKRDAQPLINFWMWCLLNPNKVARYKLFAYLSRHRLLITPSGYIVTYRMVKETTTSKEDGIYVDAHTGQFQHIIGKVSKMPRTDCDEDGANDCSRGLHTGSPDFIGIKLGDGYNEGTIMTKRQGGGHGTGYGASDEMIPQKFNNTFGNQAVICLVNPMHVVSVPNSDTRKMRSCELYIAKTTTPEEVLSHLTEVDYLVFDDDYAKIEAFEIEAQLKNAKLEGYSDGTVEALSGKKDSAAKKKLNALQQQLSALSSVVMDDKIADDVSTEEMMKVIQSRVHQVASKPAPEAKVVSIVSAIKAKNEKTTSTEKTPAKVEKEKVEKPKAVSGSKDTSKPKETVKQVVDKALDSLEKEVKAKTKGKSVTVADKVKDRVKSDLIKDFVVAEWEKKKKAKKSPKNFNVQQLKGGTTLKLGAVGDELDKAYSLLGNLDELYNKYK